MAIIFLSENTSDVLTDYLLHQNHDLIRVHSTSLVYGSIATHPDIYMCAVGHELVLSPSARLSVTPSELSTAASRLGCKLHIGSCAPGKSYPDDIAFNGACVGKYFIHNLGFTDKALAELALARGLTMVHVKQGYTKCSLAVIDDQSVITSDKGIAKVLLSATSLNVLLIRHGHIELPGQREGFIGGTCGRVGDEILFHGCISAHPDYAEIRAFIESRRLRIREFDHVLTDIGSIITLEYLEGSIAG